MGKENDSVPVGMVLHPDGLAPLAVLQNRSADTATRTMNFDDPAQRMSTFKNWTEADIHAHNAMVAGVKPAEAGEACDDESRLHEQIIAECRQRGWWFSRCRMDKATRTTLGQPDFLIFADRGRTFAIECKTAKGKLTREQAGTLHWLENLGHKAAVVRSLEDFLLVIAFPPNQGND